LATFWKGITADRPAGYGLDLGKISRLYREGRKGDAVRVSGAWEPDLYEPVPRLEVYLDPFDPADRQAVVEVLNSMNLPMLGQYPHVVVEFVGKTFTGAQAMRVAEWVHGVRQDFGSLSVPVSQLSGSRPPFSPRVAPVSRGFHLVLPTFAEGGQYLFSPPNFDPPVWWEW